MKSMFLTTRQLQWIMQKNIRVNEYYSFPAYGFTVYSKPNLCCGEWVDANPFTKSLSGDAFLVKGVSDGWCRGNFLCNPKSEDMYMREHEIMRRALIERLFLLIIMFLPFFLYNVFSFLFKFKKQ